MEQSASTREGHSLLAQAASRLGPEIFSHPVWLRFGKAQVPVSSDNIGELLGAAARLEQTDPGSACQILLLCALNQNYAGRRDDALRTAQQALALAERNSLPREVLWSAWGACAICFQNGHYERAAGYLAEMQAGLSEQHEWMLADFVEVLRQSLLHPGSRRTSEQSGSSFDQPRGDPLTLTFEWLRQWGIVTQAPGPLAQASTDRSAATAVPGQTFSAPLVPSQRRGTWGSLKLAIKGELNMHRGERNHQDAAQRIAGLRSILAALRWHLPHSNMEPPPLEDFLRIASAPVHPVASQVSAAPVSSRQRSPGKPTATRAGPQFAGQPATILTAVVQMLGSFSLTIQDSSLKLPASRGLSLLKYLLLHHASVIPREVLMDIFWPNADPIAARNNLNVAMHSLRQALRSVTAVPLLRFENGGHGLAADLEIWLDVDEFDRCVREGRRMEAQGELSAAVIEYEIAIDLYRGDFLADSPYEDWTTLDRERLRVAYLDTLERLGGIHFGQQRYSACVALCQLLLARDPCREDAHRRLMQCYSRLGQDPLALRQYQVCVEALRAELGAFPAPETKKLHDRIRRHERF